MRRESFWVPKKESRNRFQEEVDDAMNPDAQHGDDSISNLRERIPQGLLSTSEIFKKYGITLEEIYAWYKSAISRRNREPLEEDRFVSHFEGMSSEPTFAFGNKENGFLLGYYKYGVFAPTHFAPKTMRGGYTLIKELGENKKIPAIMAITEDLEKTLSKMPAWKSLDLDFLSAFRDDVLQKKIVHNSHPDIEKLMLGLVAEYLKDYETHALE